MTMINILTDRAACFAFGAHKAINHRRKYTGDCYTVHLLEVAGTVLSYGGTPEMIAAAYLHDVVEDTSVTFESVRTYFGEDVCNLVMWLTDVSKPEDGNRAHRKRLDRLHLTAATAEAQTIKYADILSNASDIIKHDVAFAKVYLPEMNDLLDAMEKGDPALRQLACDAVRRGFKVLADREGRQT